MTVVEDLLKHAGISEKPWGNYKASDYTPEQWHAACLIHQHDGDPTSKDQCKLPVMTPDGKLNKNGVHSAAAALAGSRGGVDASSEDKKKAAKALLGHYKTIGEEPPESLMHSADELVEDFLAHFGKKGMKWGVRKKGTRVSTEGKKTNATIDKYKQNKTGVRALTNHELREVNKRIKMENEFHTLTKKQGSLDKVKKGHAHAKELMAAGATGSAALLAFSQTTMGKQIKEKVLGSGKHFAK